MGSLTDRALERAGLTDIAARVARAEALSLADQAVLQHADLLDLAALADIARRVARNDAVRVVAGTLDSAGVSATRVDVDLSETGATGVDALRRVAWARLTADCRTSIAVSWDVFGIELAQVALAYGADTLFGTLEEPTANTGSGHRKGALPVVAESEAAPRPRLRLDDLLGLVRRAGRTPVVVQRPVTLSEGSRA